MKQKTDVLEGTLALMVLKTLDVIGPQHGYGIARRIEHVNGDRRAVNQGTLYPVLLKLEQEVRTIAERAAIDGREKGVSSRGSRPRVGNKRGRLSVAFSE